MGTIRKMLESLALPLLPESREEMLAVLTENVFGPIPPAPQKLTVQLITRDENIFGGAAVYEEYSLLCAYESFHAVFPVRCIFPNQAEKAPLFIFPNFRPNVPDLHYPAEEIAARGFAVISFCYQEVTADADDGYTTGVAPALTQAFGKTSKISLWAWAASRALDFALSLERIDPARTAVIGHSRLGKTALWAGANDERFACIISNESGCSGAALSRGTTGESIADITRVFPHWSVDAYKAWADHENDMPFDQHFLLAAVAPRLLYAASAAGDWWACPQNEYLCCCAASEAWERLGKPGFVRPDALPQAGQHFHQGSIGYHIRPGKHYLSRVDWNLYMDFLQGK